MVLHFGSDKVKINIGNVTYRLNMFSTITNGVKLLSSEGYTLKDSDCRYLTYKDGDE